MPRARKSAEKALCFGRDTTRTGKEKKKMIFDSHAHYDDEAFDEDREQLLESVHASGVSHIVNVGSKP